MNNITTQEAAELIKASQGKLFGVRFIKRSTKTSRRMTARLGVKKGVNGNGKAFNADDHGLLTVHEFVSVRDNAPKRGNLVAPVRCTGTQFRHVPIEGITELKIGGKTFQVS